MKKIALLTAAGIGSRVGQDIPKQFIHIDNKPLIIYTMEIFQNHPSIDKIVVVCLDGWHEVLRAYAKQFNITKLHAIVSGGATGQESIYNGLQAIKKDFKPSDAVIIHDGNRASLSNEVLTSALTVFEQYGSAITAIPCVEAVFRKCEGSENVEEIPRSELIRTQTPHIYTLKKLLWAHNEAQKRGIGNTIGTCSLMQLLGEQLHFSPGSEKNLKVTTLDDIEIFKAFLHTTQDDWIKRK